MSTASLVQMKRLNTFRGKEPNERTGSDCSRGEELTWPSDRQTGQRQTHTIYRHTHTLQQVEAIRAGKDNLHRCAKSADGVSVSK